LARTWARRAVDIDARYVTMQKMREGPSEPVNRDRFQTALSRAGKEPGWEALNIYIGKLAQQIQKAGGR
jgi:hypothetical protein